MNINTKKWILVGDIDDIRDMMVIYPPPEYNYGVRWNGAYNYVQEVSITGWNRGYRVAIKEYYPT